MDIEFINKTEKKFEAGHFAFYKFEVSNRDKNDSFIECFLKESNYKIEDNNALGRPFNIGLLTHSDFKYFNLESLTNFFNEFSKPEGWTDNTKIKNQLAFFNDIYSNSTAKDFYLISPSFFDGLNSDSNPKLNFVAQVYLWYYLVIWLDGDNILTVCQMYMD
jgi:hypothetical protein